jgi:hypothetical protein
VLKLIRTEKIRITAEDAEKKLRNAEGNISAPLCATLCVLCGKSLPEVYSKQI